MNQGLSVGRLWLAACAMLFMLWLIVTSQGGPIVIEERISVGGFELERWKSHSIRIEDYFWNINVRFHGKQLDFCTPAGWGGGYLCDEKKDRGRFNYAYIVSDTPPALLLAYGDEYWLFFEQDGQLARRRFATEISKGQVYQLNGEPVPRDQWDLRTYGALIFEQKFWLATTPLMHTELSSPLHAREMRFVSQSTDGRQIARLTDIPTADGKPAWLLVISKLDSPLVPDVYALDGEITEQMDFTRRLSREFDTFISWDGASQDHIAARIPAILNIREIDSVIFNEHVTDEPTIRRMSIVSYFIPHFTASALPSLCEILLSSRSASGKVMNPSKSEKLIDFGPFDTVHLVAGQNGIKIEKPLAVWPPSDQGLCTRTS